MKFSIKSKSKEETRSLGRSIAPYLKAGDVVLLEGDLGAGKTTFTGGVGEGLDCKEDVISPTFNIMKCYFKGRLPLYHIDAYRLENQNTELGLEEYIEGDGVSLIEWPVYIEPLIPEGSLHVTLKNLGGDVREITLEGEGEHWKEVIQMAMYPYIGSSEEESHD